VAADTDTDARAARRGAVEARRAGRGSTAAAGRKAALASGGAGDAIGRAGAAAVHCAREGPGERDGAARTGGRDTGPRKRREESLWQWGQQLGVLYGTERVGSREEWGGAWGFFGSSSSHESLAGRPFGGDPAPCFPAHGWRSTAHLARAPRRCCMVSGHMLWLTQRHRYKSHTRGGQEMVLPSRRETPICRRDASYIRAG
jgi:hypothetical protein